MRFLVSTLLLLFQPFVYANDLELIGGQPAEGKYPEIVYISSGNARCSATIISPKNEKGVIMTAAHCVANDGDIGPVFEAVEVEIRGEKYKAHCKQAPLYKTKGSGHEDHDMALCGVDRKLQIEPASISLVGPELGEEVILTGYGCITPRNPNDDSGASGGNDGILRIGKAPVLQLPEGKNHWFYTESPVALCYGDSGGPALLNRDKHLAIGINSRGDIISISLLTALFDPASISFFKEFAQSQHVEICGITKKC